MKVWHLWCAHCADEVVRWLDGRVTSMLKASLADRTAKQYSSAAGQFLLFGVWVYGAEPFIPADDWTLCRYLVWQARTVAPENLSGYLSAIRNLHLNLGLRWTELRDRYRVQWLLKGLKRESALVTKRKLPITPELLSRMRACPRLSWGDPRMKVVWVAFLLAFFTMSRKDNLRLWTRWTPSTRGCTSRVEMSRCCSQASTARSGGRRPTSWVRGCIVWLPLPFQGVLLTL